MPASGRGVTLAIETSTRDGSIAVRTGDGELHPADLDASKSHGSDLLPSIDAAMAGAGARREDLELIVIGRGPGSYTGLRVGAATALGLHRGTGARLLGVCSLDAVASAAFRASTREATGTTGYLIVRNAFGGQLYARAYAPLTREPLTEPFSATPEEILERARQDSLRLVADARSLDAMRAAGLDHAPGAGAPVLIERASAADLAEIGVERAHAILAGRSPSDDMEDASPLYLRNFEVKIRKR